MGDLGGNIPVGGQQFDCSLEAHGKIFAIDAGTRCLRTDSRLTRPQEHAPSSLLAMAAALMLTADSASPASAAAMQEQFQVAEADGSSSALLQRYNSVKGADNVKVEGAKAVLREKVQEAKKAATNAPKPASTGEISAHSGRWDGALPQLSHVNLVKSNRCFVRVILDDESALGC